MSEEKIIVGISQGDINGIGLEVIIKTFLEPQII
jgi:4-hydroxy-L-threonine phosphate dehydrogenase PdxA